jgi:EAL domain-containing protein (putative c-di-GMP-specific phosphodiesterase class I)
MHKAAVERLEVEADLRLAFERDELAVFYQPIVDLQSNRIQGVEALVRWQHPVRGLLSPDSFVPVAEECGLIDALGRHVLRVACTQMREWQLTDPCFKDLTVSVNVSPRQLFDPGLVEDVSAALVASDLSPEHLTLELTETAMMGDPDSAVSRLNALKALGIRIAVDDFGIGHSSLRYLRQFPVDILKIDKSFVWDLTRGPEDSALARAIVRLAHTMHLDAVAEGVESETQLAILRQLGCDAAQGFYFARPAAAHVVSEMLRSSSLDRSDSEAGAVGADHPGPTTSEGAREPARVAG